MQFHILDENYTPVAVMDNDLPDAIHFSNSKFHRFLTGSADFFDFETSKLHVDHNQLQVGYWIAFKYDDRDRLLYITEITEAEQDKMMSISTLSNNLDLNKENTLPFSADTARPFSWYFDIIMYDTGYEIGINEISNLTRKLSWDSEMSHRAFLQSVATQFDNAELDYEVILNSDFTIKKRLVHIKKRIGEVRDDIELRYGDNVKTVKRTTSISELCTAVRPVSKDDNDKVVDISSLNDWQELDEKGNVKFFHKKGSNLIFAPQANDRFGNRGHNVTGGGYIVHDFSYDKVSQSELFNRSHIYLKEHSVPAINYEVDGRTGAKIGDTVKIVDDGYTPPLILSARVLEQELSFDNASVEQATFGNYKALQSQISADLIAKMQQLAEENAPYKAVTLTTNGLTFKNSSGSTTLTARLYKGRKEIVPESYVWTIDGVAISGNSEQHEITAEGINGKAVVRWSAIINGVTVAFDEVTITDVSDGTITHTAYANSADGTDGFTTVYPNLNLLEGTKDFSGSWENSSSWVNDGTYKGLTVKKRTGRYNGIYKTFTVPKDGVYTFSAYVKGSGTNSVIYRYGGVNITYGSQKDLQKLMGNAFDWTRDTITLTLKANDYVWFKYEISVAGTDSILWTAGHKWEHGLTATPYMLSASEVTTADWPKYRGEYSDISSEQSTNPSNYTWTIVRGNDGTDGVSPTVKINPDTSLTIVDAKGTIKTPVLKGSDGTDGTSGIIVSSVAPASPQNGQLWQDTSTTPQLVKKWTGSEWVIWEFYAQNLKADKLDAISGNLGTMIAGIIKIMAGIIMNATGMTKKFGMLLTKKGLLSTGPTFDTAGQTSDTKMAVASLTQGELRFINMDYNENLEQVQDSGTSSANNGFIRFSSTAEKGDLLEISSGGSILLDGLTTQTNNWIKLTEMSYYKVMFGRINIRVGLTSGSSRDHIYLGTVPDQYKSPNGDMMLPAQAWYLDTNSDRHVQCNADGSLYLLSPEQNTKYIFEVSYTL